MMTEDLRGPAPVHHKPHDTEVAAKLKIEQDIGELRRVVLDFVMGRGQHGATGHEVYLYFQSDMFLKDHTESSVRTRLGELFRQFDLVVPTKYRRPNARGNNEIVWVALPFFHPDMQGGTEDRKSKGSDLHPADSLTSWERRNRIVHLDEEIQKLVLTLKRIQTTPCEDLFEKVCPHCEATRALNELDV